MSPVVEYLVIVVKADDGSFSAYVPDLPGCVCRDDSADEAKALIREAIALHIDSLRLHDEAVPQPSATACLVQA